MPSATGIKYNDADGNDALVGVTKPFPVTPVPSSASSASSATNGKITVGSSSTSVLAANANRKAATITNDSDEIMYLAFGESALMNSGYRLNANGGWYLIDSTNLFTGAVNAICTSGSKNLCVTEQ